MRTQRARRLVLPLLVPAAVALAPGAAHGQRAAGPRAPRLAVARLEADRVVHEVDAGSYPFRVAARR